MYSLLMSLNLSEKLLSVVAVLGATLFLFQLPGPAHTDTTIVFYQNEQWETRQIIELSPEIQQAIEVGDESVMRYSQMLAQVESAAAGAFDVKSATVQEVRADGWLVVRTVWVGQGFDNLNTLFFGGQADISVSVFDGDKREVSIFRGSLNPAPVTAANGTDTIRLAGSLITGSNADQEQFGNAAIWINPDEVSIRLIGIQSDPPASLDPTVANSLILSSPVLGGGNGSSQSQQVEAAAVNLIRNGDFEMPWPGQDGVASEWEGYDNMRAHFGWYEELWPEAVYHGERAQLMEIFETEANVLNRVVAIYQTVDVAPDTDYDLTMYAIMRSNADISYRNNDELEMHWGIDPLGEGNYENVEEWMYMPLAEQNLLGSFAPFPENIPLEYELITGTVHTSNTQQITLFIRGLKKFSTNVEVNFDIDDVSLVTSPPAIVRHVSTEQQKDLQPAQPSSVEETVNLPSSGAVRTQPVSIGTVTLGGLILIILGISATVGLLASREKP